MLSWFEPRMGLGEVDLISGKGVFQKSVVQAIVDVQGNVSVRRAPRLPLVVVGMLERCVMDLEAP